MAKKFKLPNGLTSTEQKEWKRVMEQVRPFLDNGNQASLDYAIDELGSKYFDTDGAKESLSDLVPKGSQIAKEIAGLPDNR